MSTGSPSTQRTSDEFASKYQKRIYAKACQACRSRKIRCEGAENPPCQQCVQGSLVCEVVSSSRVIKRSRASSSTDMRSVAVIHKSPDIIQDFERRLQRLEASLERKSSEETFPEHNYRHVIDSHTETAHSEDATIPGNALEGELARPRYMLGPSGQSVYHGETSMHDDYESPGPSPSVTRAGDGPEEEMKLRRAIRVNHKYASPEEGDRYIEAHFCWAGQNSGLLHRPYFFRDMAQNGPYFSQLLLLVIYLSGVRFTASMDEEERQTRVERFYQTTMGLLMNEMSRPSSIVTIQALLVLSGYLCAVGRTSEAWLYTGMAIRMMQDMGIHLPRDDSSISRFSAEDREMRARVYWSAYNWDKTLALTLGREPALIHRAGHSPDQIVDDSEDGRTWIPCFPLATQPFTSYPPTVYQSTRVLRYNCRLNMILESILLNMYSTDRPYARNPSYIRSAHERLDEWWRLLPEDLKLKRTGLHAVAPPSNIMLINLQYQTFRILIYRPLLTARRQESTKEVSGLNICRDAATAIHDYLTLWGRTFGNVNMVYLMMYSSFVAAGVDVVLLRVGNARVRDEALIRVHLALELLEQASSQSPGIRQGIATIRSQLDRATQGPSATNSSLIARPSDYNPPALPHSSNQNRPATGRAIVDQGLIASTGTVGPLNNISNETSELEFLDLFGADVSSTGQGLDWYWSNTPNLLNFLDEAPINSNDPFAFGMVGDSGTWGS